MIMALPYKRFFSDGRRVSCLVKNKAENNRYKTGNEGGGEGGVGITLRYDHGALQMFSARTEEGLRTYFKTRRGGK